MIRKFTKGKVPRKRTVLKKEKVHEKGIVPQKETNLENEIVQKERVAKNKKRRNHELVDMILPNLDFSDHYFNLNTDKI